jgi:hypothetical protein
MADLLYHVELWDNSGTRVDEVVAAARSIEIGRAAFREAVNRYPTRVIRLRLNLRVIEQH